MKRLIVLLIIMMLGVTGCKKDSAETQASPVVTATPVPTATPTPVPTAIPTATPEVIDIPDEDELMEEIDAVLAEAGVDDVEDIIIENVEEVEKIISMDVKIITGKRELELSAFFITYHSEPEWSVSYLVDYEKEGIFYWSPIELRKQNDIYDYKTGKLISKKSEEPKSFDELLEEFEKANE